MSDETTRDDATRAGRTGDDAMNDDEQAVHLASVYVDDAATADERALVETSTDSLDEVARFTLVRTVLAATAPIAPLSEREGQLAAALDVWDRMSDSERSGEATPSSGIDAAAAAAVTTPTSRARRNRPNRAGRRSSLSASQWLLGAAAALVAIGGVGAVVRSIVADDSSDSTESAAPPAAADAQSELDALDVEEGREVAGENVGDELDPSVSDLSDRAADQGLFPADDAMADTTSTDAAGQAGSADPPPGDAQPAPAPDDGLVTINDPTDLGIYASLAIPTLRDDAPVTTDVDFEAPFGTCARDLGLEQILEPVVYRGTEVVVGVDLGNDIVVAFTADDCGVVERVPLPAGRPTPADVPAVTRP